uniref:Receptor kinase-like protein Xa21 n=1 Tax=Leersia perrieri TaxID=77586 RepID=A0A0D9V1M3_9ORYZ
MATSLSVLPLLLLLALREASSLLLAEYNDRQALLAFKENLSDQTGALSSWNSNSSDFCRWAGVTCSRRHPERVIALMVRSAALAGSIPPVIGNLTFLQRLVLFDNMLSGEIPPIISRLPRLRYLELAYNYFTGEIPAELCNCSNLVHLSVEVNELHGAIPSCLGSLFQLQVLYLGENNLTGFIPPSLGNLTSLQRLALLRNNLEGNIPEGLSRLRYLQYIQAARNNLSGTIPPLFFNISSLQYFGFSSNKLHGRLPPDAGTYLPNLEVLFLGGIGNNFSGTIPASLSNATKIQELGLANNSFEGKVPPEIGKLCPVSVQMGSNKLQANDAEDWDFLRYFTNCTRLKELDLSDNILGGLLPSFIANLSGPITTISMGRNQMSGVIPPGIANYLGLEVVEFAENNLQGAIPEDIGRLGNLSLLSLYQNQLSGGIPTSIGNLTQLITLSLSRNQLNGSIPDSIGNLKKLITLDLSSNMLTKAIPAVIFSLPSLSNSLLLSDNYLSGVLPPQVGSLRHVTTLNLSRNNLSGELPKALGDCASLVYLDLDDNNFTGRIPQSLGNLRGLSMLYLKRNALSDSIPQVLANIHGLQQLHLAHNNLSGAIPQHFENSSALMELNLSYNHLVGEVPSHGVFSDISRFSIVGNDGLCGGIAELNLPPCDTRTHKPQKQLLLQILLPVSGIVVCSSLLLVVFFLFKGRKQLDGMNATNSLMLNEKYPRVSYHELFEATDGFAPTNLIGTGQYGSVYKGNLSLPSTTNAVVAVKVFSIQHAGSSKTFMAECEALRHVKHRNLINIITCCSSMDPRGNDFRALVFEFMPKYSLDRWLHTRSHEQIPMLSLSQLLNIAVGVADALDYLHNSSWPTVIHCDLKPSNILLNADWTAYVSDFGLAKLVGESIDQSSMSFGIRGTIGYVAPEYGAGGQASVVGDAYSFGITLLEMFTGKAPTDNMFTEGLTLHLLAATTLPEKISDIIDPALLEVEQFDKDAEILTCLSSVVEVGVSCSKENPSERMNMKHAAAKLHRIREEMMESSL